MRNRLPFWYFTSYLFLNFFHSFHFNPFRFSPTFCQKTFALFFEFGISSQWLVVVIQKNSEVCPNGSTCGIPLNSATCYLWRFFPFQPFQQRLSLWLLNTVCFCHMACITFREIRRCGSFFKIIILYHFVLNALVIIVLKEIFSLTFPFLSVIIWFVRNWDTVIVVNRNTDGSFVSCDLCMFNILLPPFSTLSIITAILRLLPTVLNETNTILQQSLWLYWCSIFLDATFKSAN